MILLFTLSMPNNNAWNGKWTGEGRFYARIRNLGKTQKAEAKGREIADKGSYYYDFGDGWAASVGVKVVTAGEAAKARRRSEGFCGYDWMIDSILDHGEIKASPSRP